MRYIVIGLSCWLGLCSLPAQATQLPVDLSVSPVDAMGQYTVSWSASYNQNDYLLLETTVSGRDIVQSGGLSYSASQPIGDSVSYQLARVGTVFTTGALIPVHLAQTSTLAMVVLPATGVTLPTYNPSGTSMTWAAVTAATDYQVEQQLDSGEWVVVQYGASTSYALPAGLETGRYQYRVRSCDSNGCSSPSLAQGFATQDATDVAIRDGNAINYVYSYHDSPINAQLQTETVQGARTDLPIGSEDNTLTHYDTAGNVTSIVNALSHTTTMANYNARGQVGQITDANNVITELQYHPRGWLTHRTVKDPGGNTSLDALTQFDYDNVGQLTQITLPDGSFLSYEYDDARRLTAIENTLGERIEYGLDNAGNRTSEVICSAGTGGQTGTACSIQKTQTRIFDALSRLRKDIGSDTAIPIEKTTRYDYTTNDNLNKVTDGNDEETNQSYDALNRLVEQVDPDADNANQSDNPRVMYTYDDHDRIESVTDQEGLVTLYTYNVWGDMTQVVSPDTGTTDYRYDNAGNRIRKEDASGQVTLYRYDALNRLIAVLSVGQADEQVKYLYDDPSVINSDINYGVGRLTTIIDESGRTDYRYDPRGNVIQKAVINADQTYITRYAYTPADRLKQITYPSGRVVNYQRDTDGRIVAVSTSVDNHSVAQTVVDTMSYKPFGPVTGYDYGNGIARTLTFDTDYLLSTIDDTGASGLMDWVYGYDANANIDAILNTPDALKDQGFTYDRLNRLETAVSDYGTITYSYDDVGNRLIKTLTQGSVTATETTTYDYQQYPPVGGVRSDGSHQLDQVDTDQTTDGSIDATRSFQYSADGHTGKDTKANGDVLDLTYNSHQRYEQLDINSAAMAWYQHNALGQRIKKTTLADTIHYHYDEQGRLLAETDQNGTIRDYIYADDMRVARYDGNTAYYFHNDHLGRPIALTDATKTVVWQAEYLPFGQIKTLVSNTTDNELGFPGQVLDGESGFYYNYFRDYDPTTGRYVQADPLGILLETNNPQRLLAAQMGIPLLEAPEGFVNHNYGYVGQNPLIGIDPTGEYGWVAYAAIAYAAYSTYTTLSDFNDCVKDCPTECPTGDTSPNVLCKRDCFFDNIFGAKKGNKGPRTKL